MRGIRRGIVRVVMAFCACILLLPSPASAVPAFDAPGDGTSGHPYLITTCQQLQDMGNLLGAHYKLMRDIDCSTFGNFSMIGNYYASSAFTGTLDGNNYSIIGLQSNLGGPFGYTNGATIKDLQLKDSTYSINTSIYAGALIDVANSTTLTNVHNSVTMNGSAPQVGGLIGASFGTTNITKSSFTGTIGVTGASISGGLVGLFTGDGSITDSYSYGMINGATIIGGLVGRNDSEGSIIRSYSASALGNGISRAGGLIGTHNMYMPTTLSDSFSASTMVGSVSSIGGIIGEIDDETPTGATYYDDTRAGGFGACVGNSPATPYACDIVNVGGADPNYFKGNSANTPLDNWDFSSSGPWQTRTGEYPELRSKGLLHSNTFFDYNGDGINDQTQGTVNSGADSVGGEVTFVLGQTANCINDNSGFWTTGPTYSPADNASYQVQTSSYWQTDIYCRDAGTAIPVTMILDKVYDTSRSALRHFNPGTDTYSTISGATFSAVTINGMPKTAVSYTITEGGPLDPDGTANGFITDPVALVSNLSLSSAIASGNPTVPNTGVRPRGLSIFSLILATTSGLIMLGISGYIVRRKKDY